jgi:4-amino-4-deoxy-L-arabinose transferase-like glycosyltransferase
VTRLIWSVVALVTVLRGLAAFTLPLTGDEAYYWEWSRRLAFGYVDHPPAVAFTVAAFAWLGHQPGFVRLGFVLCGIVASLALAAATTELSGPSTGSGQAGRAGAIAALALTLTPLASLVFGTATPDGPYLMFWALALWFAARAFKRDSATDWVLLGLAVGGLLLSRVLGFALLCGILAYSLFDGNRKFWRRGVSLMLASAFVVFLPFLLWNATHGWMTLTFALVHRHEQTREFSTLRVLLAQIAAYSPGIWVAAIVCALRPKNALLAWTALPQFVLVMLLSLFERVEFSWVAGFFVSLCAMLGVAYVELSRRVRTAWTIATVVPAAIVLSLLFAFTFAPVATYRLIVHGGRAPLENGGPFEVMTYSMVAADAAKLARERDAVVMTDGYGFSSVIDFDAGLTPVLIGYDWQGREARAWYPDSNRPLRALFVDKEPLATRPDFVAQLDRACARVVDGGRRGYRYKGTGPRFYYFTWCEEPAPDGLAILRWER